MACGADAVQVDAGGGAPNRGPVDLGHASRLLQVLPKEASAFPSSKRRVAPHRPPTSFPSWRCGSAFRGLPPTVSPEHPWRGFQVACPSSSVTLQLVHPSLPRAQGKAGLSGHGGLLMQAQHRWVCPQPRADTGPGEGSGPPLSRGERAWGPRPLLHAPTTAPSPDPGQRTDDHTDPCGHRRGHQLSRSPAH